MQSAIYIDNSNSLKGNSINMIINNNYPVNVKARDEATNEGHSFIFDGWLRLEYSLLGFSQVEVLPGVQELREDNFQHRMDLVHINFGWNGRCDGYYLPDAIDLTEAKYAEYAEDADIVLTSYRVYNLNIGYIIYSL